MDIFFHDPADIPLPPSEVRIREFRAQPYPDGRRVRIYLELTPFQKRPNGEIVILDELLNPVATASIIETIDPQMEMTMHIRRPETKGNYSIQVEIFYEYPQGATDNPDDTPLPSVRQVVDQANCTFIIE